MYLYNTTFVVDRTTEESFFAWLKKDFLPKFSVIDNLRVELYEIDNRLEHTPGASSYSLQFQCVSIAELRDIEKISSENIDASKRFGVVYFSTMMQSIEL